MTSPSKPEQDGQARKYRRTMGPAMEYRRKTPREGEVVCHNFPPGRPGRPYGDMGFRFWAMRREDMPETFARCRCEWPVEEHYSTRFAD